MSQVEIYQTADGQTQVDVIFDTDTVWLSQKQLSILFDKNVMTIYEHIKNIYNEGELNEHATIRKSLVVQKEGSRNETVAEQGLKDFDLYCF